MTPETFFANFGHLAEAPNGVQKLRELILSLAVRGKLVPQDPNDETASVLLTRIKAEKERLVKEKKIKKSDPLPPVSADEEPYALPQGWEWERLNNISYLITDGEHISPRKTKSGIPLLTAKNVTEKGVNFFDLQYVSREDADKFWERCNPEFGDILVCSRGTIGRCTVNNTPERYCLMGSVILVKPWRELNSDFLNFLLSTAWAQALMKGMSGATAVQALYLKDIRSCPIPFPPLAEQHHIVAKVDQLMALCEELEERQQRSRVKLTRLNNAALDRLLNARETEIFTAAWRLVRDNFDLLYTTPETIAKLRQAILQLAVQGKLVPQNPNDEPASVLLARIKAEKERLVKEKKIRKSEPLPPVNADEAPYELPRGWKWARFPELGELGRGKSKHRPRNDPALYKDGKYPLVQTGDVARAKCFVRTYKGLYGEIGLAQSRLWPKGTMCITIAANIADSGILEFDACFPDSVVGFVPSVEIGDALYFEFFMRTAKARLLDFAPSTAQKNINLEILEQLLIPLPPLPELFRIVAKVDQLMALCDELEAKLAKSQAKAEKMATAAVKALIAA
ncbi:MAG: restriction endonuclease subunit S [Desulfuromonadales bacterium]|nr:MAG: restriction endonuclease subunit S [Desulfuromonadales bacterium]